MRNSSVVFGRAGLSFSGETEVPDLRRAAQANQLESASFRPFCSKRCRTIDLGKWLDGGHRIESQISEEDLDQGLPTDGEPQ